jgi:hypothetical protein
VNVIKEDPKNPDVLYVGTDLGVYVSLDGGGEWHSLPGGNLPSSFYQDLVVHPEEDILIAATHGRGIWALDVRPLQSMTPELMSEPVHLFDMEPVDSPQGFGGGGVGTSIHYWVGTGANQALVQVKDAGGRVVGELSGPAEPGFHALSWDLTQAGAQPPSGGRGMGRVPRVPPGTYTVVVTVGGSSAEGSLVVEG